MNLIDANGMTTTRLDKLVAAEGDAAKAAHQEVIKSAYSFLFKPSFHLTTATPRMLEQAFAEAGAQGDSVRKCIAFFVLYAKSVDLPLSPHLKAPIVRAPRVARRKGVNGDSSAAKRTRRSSESRPTPPPPPPPSGSSVGVLLEKFPKLIPDGPRKFRSNGSRRLSA